MFVEKTNDELEKMSIEELAEYHKAKYNHMATELKELQEKVNADTSKEDVDALNKQVQELKDNQFEQLKSAYKELGLKVEKALVFRPKDEKASVQDQLKDALEANKETLERMSKKDESAIPPRIIIKAAGDSFVQTDTAGGSVPQPTRVEGYTEINRRRPFVKEYIRVVPFQDGDTIEWVEMQNYEETTGGTAEAALKNDLHFEWVVRSEAAKTRTVTSRVSTRMLRRVGFMEEAIRSELMRSLEIDFDEQIIRGDGTGQNLNGLTTVATAFAAPTTMATAIPNANEVDVLRAAIVQVMKAPGLINGASENAGFDPTVIFINPEKGGGIDLLKGTDGHYLMPPFTSEDGTSIKGIPVIESNFVQDDEFFVLDGSRARLYLEDQLTVQIGLNADDFKRNMRTLLAEHAALLVVPVNERGAVVRGTFTEAKGALASTN